MTSIANAMPVTTRIDKSDIKELLLTVTINQQDIDETTLLLRKGSEILIDENDIRRWRLVLSVKPVFTDNAKDYYALSQFKGVSYRIDSANQRLYLDVAPDAMLTTTVHVMNEQMVHPQRTLPGGFFNYDILGQSTSLTNELNSQIEVGLFNQWGVGVSTFVGQDITDNKQWVRLDTGWTIDKPDSMTSIRVGDAISSSGSWGRPVRFAGLQWASNFLIQPSFITSPLPSVKGEAVLPSMVDIFVGNQRLLSQHVQPGPFSIDHVPTISGLRQMNVVVRDLLGREQIITQPYYTSPRLLKQGLSQFSYEVGSIRNNYGIDSNDYGRWVAVASHRQGLSNSLTGEVHTELLHEQQTLGASASWLVPTLGVIDGSIATSHSHRGFGHLFALGFNRHSSPLSFGGHIQYADSRFMQLGIAEDTLAPKLIASLSLGYSTRAYGNFSVNHIYQEYRDREKINLINANYSLTLGKKVFVNFSAFSSLEQSDNKGIALVLSVPLGKQTHASATMSNQNGRQRTLMQMQRNLPVGEGFGYQALMETGDSDRVEAGLSMQNKVGHYQFEAAHVNGLNNYRANVRGGLAVLGGDAYFSRTIDSSFAVVQVPGYQNVRIYADNQHTATTDKKGNALVSGLRAYQNNHVRIEQADLPLDAQIDLLEMEAVPYFRSGSLLRFPVRQSNGALLTIITDDGQALPAGAQVTVMATNATFPVGFNGKTYLTGLEAENQLTIRWHDQQCTIDLPYIRRNEYLPDLGTFICHELMQ